MSYSGAGMVINDWDIDGDGINENSAGDVIEIQKPAIYDIKAIQHIYGMTPGFNEGDTPYIFEGVVYASIYDTGGIDTIDLSFYSGDFEKDITLDLRGGRVSEIGTDEIEMAIYDPDTEEWSLQNEGFQISISENTVIENAITGSGDDVIICNDAINTITCGYGGDFILEISTGDIVYGGHGYDYFFINSFDFILIDGGTGTNTIDGEGDGLVFYGTYTDSTIDLRSFTDSQLTGIEDIHADDDKATTIIISRLALENLEGTYMRDLDGDGDQDFVHYIYTDSALDQVQVNAGEFFSVSDFVVDGDKFYEGYDYYRTEDGDVWFAVDTGTSTIEITSSSSSASARTIDDNTNDNNSTGSGNDYIPVPPNDDNTRTEIELPDLSLFVNDFALGSITLPETVVTMEDRTLPDLSALENLLGDQGESLALDFTQVGTDSPVLASIESIKPVVVDWTSQTDPFIESDWNPIIEELYYTAEFG
jgi:hypothetical protein